MPNVYEDLEMYIFPEQNDFLGIYNGHRDCIINFLNNPNEGNAKELYYFVADIHMKTPLFDLMQELKDYENRFSDILPDHREHYMHSCNVYLLGLAIYNSCEVIRNGIINKHSPNEEFHAQKSSFLFKWSLASLLHDLSYPLEMSIKSFNKLSSYLHGQDGRRDIVIKKEMIEYFDTLGPLTFEHDVVPTSIVKDTSIGLIAGFLSDSLISNNIGDFERYSYEKVYGYLDSTIKKNLKKGIFDHGVFSALIALKRIHKLYLANPHWNTYNYYDEVVDASTAMFLHNFYKKSEFYKFIDHPIYNFRTPSSLGFLLSLCDTLCEWNRNAMNDQDSYRLFIQNQNQIRFQVPRSKRDKLQQNVAFFGDELSINIIV